MKKENWEWIHQFIDRELAAPFRINKDQDYYKSLLAKYQSMITKAKGADADLESIKIIEDYSNKICKSIELYYGGQLIQSQQIIVELVKDVCDNPFACDEVNNSVAFPGVKGEEVQLYRARVSENAKAFKSKDMLHVPFSLRAKTVNGRFSIPGIPCLYLANSSYCCWIEMERPEESKFNVSPVLLDNTQRILNLAVSIRDFSRLESFGKTIIENVHCWLKLLILKIATSFRVEENNRNFRSEYIIAQQIMIACEQLNVDGVAYQSTQVETDDFASVAVNVVLFAKYNGEQYYSEICNHLKIDDSFNYSVFKQLGYPQRCSDYQLKSIHNGWINNIGTYSRQFDYSDTEFCKFDKFLFYTWKNTNEIDWGNAIPEN